MTNTIVVNDRNKNVLRCYYVQCHARCFYTHHLVNSSEPYETGLIVDSMLQTRIVSSREVLDLVHSCIAVGTEFSPRQSNVMDCDFNNCVLMCLCDFNNCVLMCTCACVCEVVYYILICLSLCKALIIPCLLLFYLSVASSVPQSPLCPSFQK